jgi:DNA-binding HxlR family transcriptional regulator
MRHWTDAHQFETPVARAASECAVEDWLSFLGHRWTACILWHLGVGPRRHGELAALLDGITPKVLTERLEQMEKRRLIDRQPQATFPRGVLYSLRPEGRRVVEIVRMLEPFAAMAERESALP